MASAHAVARGAARCASQAPYLTEVPRPLPAAPLGVRRRYLAVVLWPLPRCASRVINRGAQADARGATQVLDRGAQAVAWQSVPCASQVLDRGAEVVSRGAARCASHCRT
jgi:hypothetical protein